MNEELKRKLDEINTKFGETKLKMNKESATEEQIRRLHDIRRQLEEKAKMESDDLSRLNLGEKIKVRGGTALGGLPQEGLPDASKIVNLGKESMWRKAANAVDDIPLKKAKPSLGGLAAVGLGTAASFLPEKSMAADIAGAGTRAMEEGDPLDFIMGGREVGAGSDKLDIDLLKQKLADEQARRQGDIDKVQDIRGVAKFLGGEADVNPVDAEEMTGEQMEPQKKQAIVDALTRLRNRK